MNFYKHHIGDYAAATAHLSIIEDGCYSRLLRIYYRDEKPLPADLKAVQRLVGARSKDEREAVDTVLSEFFYLDDDGWHNKRCDEEIARANAQAETNREIARAREARKRSTGNARSVERTEHESLNESSPSREPSQTPDSRQDQLPHEGLSRRVENEGARSTPQAVNARLAIIAAAGYVNARTPAANDPRLTAALDAGVTVDELAAVAAEAATHTPAKPWAWVIATALGRRTDAAQGATHAPRQQPRRVGLADRHPGPGASPDDDARPVIEGKAVAVRA